MQTPPATAARAPAPDAPATADLRFSRVDLGPGVLVNLDLGCCWISR